LCMVGWFFCSIAYESLQRFHPDIVQFAFTIGYEQLTRHFFNSSINLGNLACCALASRVNIICSQEQTDSKINNNFLGPVICGRCFRFCDTSHNLFWIKTPKKYFFKFLSFQYLIHAEKTMQQHALSSSLANRICHGWSARQKTDGA
jgi:hypothetical protein